MASDYQHFRLPLIESGIVRDLQRDNNPSLNRRSDRVEPCQGREIEDHLLERREHLVVGMVQTEVLVEVGGCSKHRPGKDLDTERTGSKPFELIVRDDHIERSVPVDGQDVDPTDRQIAEAGSPGKAGPDQRSAVLRSGRGHDCDDQHECENGCAPDVHRGFSNGVFSKSSSVTFPSLTAALRLEKDIPSLARQKSPAAVIGMNVPA